jgi:hypothetical protein
LIARSTVRGSFLYLYYLAFVNTCWLINSSFGLPTVIDSLFSATGIMVLY